MNASPLVVTEHGTGFLCHRTRELRLAFRTHVAPEPKNVRPATEAEAREFFARKAAIRDLMTAHYERADHLGLSTGD